VTESRPTAADTARAYIDALNRGSIDEAAGCVSEDFINEHTATLGSTVVGRGAYRERLRGFLAQFPGLRYQEELLIADGCDVAVAYRLSGAYLGAGAATGRPFTIRGMFRFRVVDGLIVHRIDYWDSAEFQRQMAAASPADAKA
jgi:steroid delta-isomerase-like uncharacterized protein